MYRDTKHATANIKTGLKVREFNMRRTTMVMPFTGELNKKPINLEKETSIEPKSEENVQYKIRKRFLGFCEVCATQIQVQD
jgi:hypothetical protein